MENEEFLTSATTHVIRKKDLKGIDEEFAGKVVRKVFSESSKDAKKLSDRVSTAESFSKMSKNMEYALFFKKCRKELREKYGMFQKASRKGSAEKLRQIEHLKKLPEQERRKLLEAVLLSHTSTSERIPHYAQVFDFCLGGLQKLPKKSVLDIGAGVNAAAFALWKPDVKYLAYDISKHDAEIANAIGKATGLDVHAGTFDFSTASDEDGATRISAMLKRDCATAEIKMPFDVCMILKTVDVLEKQKKGAVLALLKCVPAKQFIVSFATKSLGQGKSIPVNRRKWFVNMLEWKGYAYETKEFPNEVFFKIKTLVPQAKA